MSIPSGFLLCVFTFVPHYREQAATRIALLPNANSPRSKFQPIIPEPFTNPD